MTQMKNVFLFLMAQPIRNFAILLCMLMFCIVIFVSHCIVFTCMYFIYVVFFLIMYCHVLLVPPLMNWNVGREAVFA